MGRFLLGVISGVLFCVSFVWEAPSNIDFLVWILTFVFIIGFAIWQAEERKWW